MKLRVLCLHSFRTSGTGLQRQITAFSNFGQTMNEFVELSYLDGAVKCDAEAEAKMPAMLKQFFEPPYYEWWNARTDSSDGRVYYDHFDESLEKVLTHVASNVLAASLEIAPCLALWMAKLRN